MKGSTFKLCKCRDENRKELGAKCPKLKRANGTWNPHHGTWYFKAELEAGPGGKRRTLKRGGFTREEDAAEAMTQELAKDGAGVDVKAKHTTGAWLEAWLDGKRKAKGNTVRGYETHIRVHLIPNIGHIPLAKLRVDHVTKMFDAIAEAAAEAQANNTRRTELKEIAAAAGRLRTREGRAARSRALEQLAELPPYQRPTGLVTHGHIRDTLRAALNTAIKQRLISDNVAAMAEVEVGKKAKAVVWTPSLEAAWREQYEATVAAAHIARGGRFEEVFDIWRFGPTPSPVMVWTPTHTATFLEAAAEHPQYAALHLIAFAGMRRGETVGVEWPSIDLDAGTLRVIDNRVQVGWSVVDGGTKTEASEGTVSLDALTVKVLRAHKVRQAERKLALGPGWAGSKKVFTTDDGRPLHPAALSEQFRRIACRAGLPPIRLHDLRHGVATMGLAAGLDTKIVSAMLRHSTTTITQDLYTSVLPGVAASAAEAIAAMVPLRVVSATAGPPTVPPRSDVGFGGGPEKQNGQVTKAT